MGIFDNVKVGDKVLYYPNCGFGIVATVTKVTPAGNFATDKTYKILWNKDGNARGADIWQRSCVRPYSEEEYERIIAAKIISKAIDMMRKCSKSDLTVDQAKAIIDILENEGV